MIDDRHTPTRFGWQEEIDRKHREQISMHEAAWGSPLGALREQPTQRQLDSNLEVFKSEKYGTPIGFGEILCGAQELISSNGGGNDYGPPCVKPVGKNGHKGPHRDKNRRTWKQ